MSNNKVIPAEIKSDVRIIKFISMRDIIFLLILMAVTSNFSPMVHPMLQAFYLVYCLIFGIILVCPVGSSNPKRKIYELILIIISKSRTTYKTIKEINNNV